jgi:hypothetical protein
VPRDQQRHPAPPRGPFASRALARGAMRRGTLAACGVSGGLALAREAKGDLGV